MTKDTYKAHNDFVKRIAGTLTRFRRHLFEDAVNAGWVGLLEALYKRPEMESEEAFHAYASLRVRGAVLDLLRKNDHMTRGLRIKMRRVNEVEIKLANSLGRAPSSEEIASVLGLSVEALHSLLMRMSMSKDSLEFNDELPHSNPNVEVEAYVIWGKAIGHIERMPERFKDIMVRHYLHDQTILEISQIYGVSQTVTNKTHLEALSLLRNRLLKDMTIKIPNYPRNHKVLAGRKRSVDCLYDQIEQAGVDGFDPIQCSCRIQHFEADC